MPNTALLRKSLKELDKAKPGYIEAGKFYDGTFAEPFQSLMMQRMLLMANPDYKMVLSAVPVDAVVEKLEIVDVQASTPEATEVLQDDIWKPNNLRLEHKPAILAAEKFGDAYLFVWPEDTEYEVVESESENTEEEEQEAAEETEVEVSISITYQSPFKVRVFYDEANPRKKTHAVKVLDTGKGKQKCAWLYYADGRIEKYETPENKCTIDDFYYVEDVPNEMDGIPFVHLRNDFPYGTPLHKKAYGPQNSITKLTVNQLSGSDFDAFPQRWALAKTRGTTGGDDIDWDGDDSTVPDKEGNTLSNLTSGPGRIWDLSGFDNVGEFGSADVQQYLAPIELYVKMMASATGTPLHYFTSDTSGGGTPTGESVRQRDARLNTKAEWHQKTLSNGFEEALLMGMEYLGYEDESVSIKWKPIEYVTEEEKLDLVQKKVAIGIPLAVALAEAGYDEDTVRTWTTGQPNEGELTNRIAMLNSLGDALQKLGTAATMGIDMTQINEVVDALVGKFQGLNDQDDAEEAEQE